MALTLRLAMYVVMCAMPALLLATIAVLFGERAGNVDLQVEACRSLGP